jgi:hypothetical protein
MWVFLLLLPCCPIRNLGRVDSIVWPAESSDSLTGADRFTIGLVRKGPGTDRSSALLFDKKKHRSRFIRNVLGARQEIQ